MSAYQEARVNYLIEQHATNRFSLNERLGSVVNDSVGNILGTITGATWIADGGLSFDGVDDHLRFNTAFLSASVFTIVFNFKRDGNPGTWGDAISTAGFDTSASGIHIGVNPYGAMRFSIFSNGKNLFDSEVATNVCDNQWHNIVIIVDLSKRKFVSYEDYELHLEKEIPDGISFSHQHLLTLGASGYLYDRLKFEIRSLSVFNNINIQDLIITKALVLSNGEYIKYVPPVKEHIRKNPEKMKSNTDNGIVLTSNSQNPYGWSSSFYQLFDGIKNSDNNGWANKSGQWPSWLMIDYGHPVEIVQYAMSYGYTNSQFPRVWYLQGSNDASTWTNVDYRTTSSWTQNTSKSFGVATPGKYRYYRLYITSGGSSFAVVSELELYERVEAADGYYEIVSVSEPTSDIFINNGIERDALIRGDVELDPIIMENNETKIYNTPINLNQMPKINSMSVIKK